MKLRASPLFSGVVGMALASGALFASGASAADLPTKKEAAPAPLHGPASCMDPVTFLTTDCPLSWYGITVYGTLDMGVGWEAHGAPLNDSLISGVQELVRPSGNRALWLPTPGGLSQSLVGIKAKEEIAPNWFFVSDLSFAFDPYTLTAANGPNSFLQNNGVALNHQTATGDSSRAGQFYNGAGYVGISNPTYGTLTVGRVNSLSLDGIIDYDPMGAAFAFSVIGWSGQGAGAGDTEDARISSGVKYRVNVGNFRAAALAQIGGYELNNGAQAEYEGGLGADFSLGDYGGLSTDAVFSYDKGAVAASPLNAAQNALFPGTIAARISDDTGLQLLAKWTNQRVKVSGGYEIIQFKDPSDPQLSGFTSIAGIPIAGANINNTAFAFHPEILQIMWLGARYAFTDTLDAGLAYYQYFQNSYGKTSCHNASSPTCSGTLDAVSFDVDWKFAKKFDLYGGMMYSEVHDGLAAGYLYNWNFSPTVGLRFKF
jgi:predicted porin